MLGRMTTGQKIIASFVCAFALLAAMGVVALVNTERMSESIGNLADRKLPTLAALGELDEAKTAAMRGLNAMLLRRGDASFRAETRGVFTESLKQMDHAETAYEAIPHHAETLVLWKAFKSAGQSWRSAADPLVALVDERSRLLAAGKDAGDPALTALDDRIWSSFLAVRAQFKGLDDALAKVAEKTLADGAAAGAAGDAAAATALRAVLATLAAGLVFLAVLGLVMAKAIGRSVRVLIAEAGKLREAVEEGKLAVRGDVARVTHEFRPIVEGMNETMEAFAKPLAMTVEYVTRTSKGDIPPRITDEYRGDFNQIKDAFNTCIDAVNALVADAGMLARAAVEGKLATRADAGRHQGDFKKVVQGVNDTLDAVIGPLNVAARYVDDIAKGAIPAKLTDAYRGDFDVLKRNLNTCIDAVNLLVADAGTLAQAAVEGKLATRADAGRHQGDFQKIVQGVNDTLDAVIGPLNVAAKYVDDISRGAIPAKLTDAYRGDFDVLKRNLNTCVDAVNLLVADADRLAQAAVAGQLKTRADAGKHQGDFRKIVEGVNQTLDAVMAPIDESARVLELLAHRDLRARVHGKFQGDHARIKESVNGTALALHDAMAQVADAVEQVSSAATQIAASSQAVASGASEQASSLEETSSSIDSVSGMTRQSAENASQANGLTQSARTAATEGAASMEQMQAAMGKIKASAEGTSQIIRDINDIAFQTNLLALNAAVEAARAGEAGRGFAVVAEEVRSLALRAKEAATKTEELIRQSVKEATEGEVTAKHVAQKLGEIVQGVGKVTDIVSEIAATAKEQTSGIDQVNKAVAEMNKVTQQNAASAEESSSAASELSGQSEELAAMVGAFQLDRSAGKGLQRPAPAPALASKSAARPTNGTRARQVLAEKAFPMDDETATRDF